MGKFLLGAFWQDCSQVKKVWNTKMVIMTGVYGAWRFNPPVYFLDFMRSCAYKPQHY